MTDSQAVHAPLNTENEPCGDLSIRTMAMPADTNQNGDIFGGWLLSWMDIGGGIFASKMAKSRTVTVAIEAMNFRKPVFVGDVVSVHADLVRIGKTSITVHVEAWVLRRKETHSILVTDGNFTYVSIDDQGHPQVIKRDEPPISAYGLVPHDNLRMSVIVDRDVGKIAVGYQDRIHFIAAQHPGLEVDGDRGPADPHQIGVHRNQIADKDGFAEIHGFDRHRHRAGFRDL